MKIFGTGDYVRITGDLVDDYRPESFIGMTGTIESYAYGFLDKKDEFTEYFVKLEGLSKVQEEYLAKGLDIYGELPFFFENELELID